MMTKESKERMEECLKNTLQTLAEMGIKRSNPTGDLVDDFNNVMQIVVGRLDDVNTRRTK